MKQTQAKSLAPEVKKTNMLPDFNVDTVRCANRVHPYRGVQIALWAIPPLGVNRYLCEVHRVRSPTGYTIPNTIPSG